MLSVDRDALLCDIAETYHIYDFRALPVTALAVLCCGLKADSRINRKLLGHNYMSAEMLLACVVDNIATLQYRLFGKEGDEPPKLLYHELYGSQPQTEKFGYANGEDFLEAWKQNGGG